MAAKNRIWEYLITHDRQATNYEIAEAVRGTKGALSWGQRLRDLRKDLRAIGKDLSCTEVRPGVYLYRVEDSFS